MRLREAEMGRPWICALALLALAVPVRAQDPPDVQPGEAQAGAAAASPDIDATPGTLLPTGLAQFGDPVALRGLMFGVQAGLGAASTAGTFGYDGLSVNLRWTPGTNLPGRRFSLLVGVADWQAPAFSRVFPDSLLRDLVDPDVVAARTTNATAFGLSAVLYGNRTPSPDHPQWARLKPRLDELTLQAAQEQGPLRRETILQRRDSLKWTGYLRPVLRAPTITSGVLLRTDGIATETDARAVDAFLVGAIGRGLLDLVAAVHRLAYLTTDELPRYANVGSAGVFLDLADRPPVPVLGLSVGYGVYAFRELHDLIPERSAVDLDPRTRRFDVVLSFSGAPSQDNRPVAGVGLKFSHVSPSLLESRNLLTVLFSTNFKLIR